MYTQHACCVRNVDDRMRHAHKRAGAAVQCDRMHAYAIHACKVIHTVMLETRKFHAVWQDACVARPCRPANLCFQHG